jgi:hypothetical protein
MDYGAALGDGSSFTTGFTGLNKLQSIQHSAFSIQHSAFGPTTVWGCFKTAFFPARLQRANEARIQASKGKTKSGTTEDAEKHRGKPFLPQICTDER